MKACTALPWSSARIAQQRCWRAGWKQTKRCSSTNAKNTDSTERRRNTASPIVPETTTSPSFDVDQEKKTIETAIGHLPLSPIMDPSYWDATTRHQAPKAKRGKATNSVERQFRKNPFARALATPIRQCTASRTRLPSFFLQDFNLIAHPETGQPWWVPHNLAWNENENENEASEPQQEITSDEQDNAKSEGTKSEVSKEIPRPKGSTNVQPYHIKPYGPSAYVLARQDLLSAFTVKNSGYENQPKRLFGGSSSRYADLASKAIWRQDMDSLILDRIRRDIVGNLLYLSRLCTEDSRYYIVKCYGWDDIQYKHQGAVLWLGDTAESDEATQFKAQPGPFATYDICKENVTSTVAVHNIPMLLGTPAVAEIRGKSTILGDGFLFMLAGRRTTELQMKLWRLQGYLADYTEPF
ncbi:hypothetical protein F5Y01DRAFT_279760 [Xylaria sp. FL0043]|nr:hypothetical protein F5Y01DRAFT_279760 [Xylaria sp. FL0043]